MRPYSYRDDPAVPRSADDKPAIIFDGNCVLCSNSAQFVMRHDEVGAFRLMAAQSPLGEALYRHYGLQVTDYETMILIADRRCALQVRGRDPDRAGARLSVVDAGGRAAGPARAPRCRLQVGCPQPAALVRYARDVLSPRSEIRGPIPRMTRVLVLGGYGTFGGRLARLLADEPRLTLIVAGRSLEAAQSFCASVEARDAGRRRLRSRGRR